MVSPISDKLMSCNELTSSCTSPPPRLLSIHQNLYRVYRGRFFPGCGRLSDGGEVLRQVVVVLPLVGHAGECPATGYGPFMLWGCWRLVGHYMLSILFLTPSELYKSRFRMVGQSDGWSGLGWGGRPQPVHLSTLIILMI